MLLELHVRNLALIDELQVEFGEGLNILTGETGAGKSVIIGSVALALGQRAKGNIVREGSEWGLAELVFSVSPAEEASLMEMGIEPEDGTVIMSRRILPTGRSVCRINSETVSAAKLKAAASLLIDIHGQNEHQALLEGKNHLKYLDSYAKDALSQKKAAYSKKYSEYGKIRAELSDMRMDDASRAREIDFLRYEADEIRSAALKAGEDEELEALYKKLSNGRRITESTSRCAEYCFDGRENASDAVSRAVRSLMEASEYDEKIGELCGQLCEIEELLADFGRSLTDYMEDIDVSEEALDEVQRRLDTINNLKAKYGRTIEDILKELEKKEERIELLENYDEQEAALFGRLRELEEELSVLSDEISQIRREYAEKFTHLMRQALKDLNFMDVRFDALFTVSDLYTPSGRDEMRFMVALNPGEKLMPLEDVASGGELSRIMLALKTILAQNDDIETLIFDEIDAGISGRTAQKVAEKIKLTANDHQVICITHLPQIAAMADSHFLIEKEADEDRAVSRIRLLDEEESIEELARMLGGAKITEAVRENAREMKALAGDLRP